MASIRDTATFFSEGSASQFEYVLGLYEQVLKLKAEKRNKKPEELIKLDNWYQNELPKKIKSRGKDAHLNHEELVQLMKWKQTRGKFFPQLNYLIKVNTPRAVMAETKKAFRKLPNLEQAITALSNLKGVGTTMASALLAAAAPDQAPFMADECLMAIPDIEGIDYTTKEYLNFVSHIQTTVQRLNNECQNGHWSPHRVELALWTHYVASELKPELLERIPNGTGEVESSAGETNGDHAKEELQPPTTTTSDALDGSDESSMEANGKVGSSSSVVSGANEEDTCTSLTSGGEETVSSTLAQVGSEAESAEPDATPAPAPAPDNNNDESNSTTCSSSDEPPTKKPKGLEPN